MCLSSCCDALTHSHSLFLSVSLSLWLSLTLTHEQADSLGGDSKTLMFCCVAATNRSESLQSLQFASRVRSVELGPAKAHMDVEEADAA